MVLDGCSRLVVRTTTVFLVGAGTIDDTVTGLDGRGKT